MIKKINAEARQLIEKNTGAGLNMCWGCSSCDTECPMNISTNRLRPQKIVHLAYTGMWDEMVYAPEIWYCLTCRRCNQVCPNLVKPADIMSYARMEALRNGVVSHEQLQIYFDLFAKFQRVRWHAASLSLNGNISKINADQWMNWFETQVKIPAGIISRNNLLEVNDNYSALSADTKSTMCFTCGECSSACPISGSPNVFDPRFIFRMANLGMLNEIMSSPSIWLCLDCGRCTEACSQKVDGREIIRDLKKMAIQNGVVANDITSRIQDANYFIYKRFLDEIDMVFRYPVKAVA